VGELRLARPSDADAISELMKASVRDLFPRFYDERQTASAVEHIAHLDTQLIEGSGDPAVVGGRGARRGLSEPPPRGDAAGRAALPGSRLRGEGADRHPGARWRGGRLRG